jgi:hypothetical protein
VSILALRTAQRRFLRLVDEHRRLAFVARRQYGKTTTFAKIALKKMMKRNNHTVIFGSAKLNLSREIVRKEAEILQAAIADMITEAKAAKGAFQIVDGQTQKVPDVLKPDDFADLFEAQRLEFRFYHTRSSYSRTKVVALRPDTVGETGDLMCDEVGRVANWREVCEAVNPIVQSNPEFRLLLSTTPPPDDTHYSYEQLAPPVGTQFRPNLEGNLYKSEMGIMVLRVDAWDAYADGVPIYDLDSGKALAPEESRAGEYDKDAWDRNFGCKFVAGGIGACSIMALDSAQSRGIGKCEFVRIDRDSDLDGALSRLRDRLGAGRIGIGFDVATTTKATSNPAGIAICEQTGNEYAFPLILAWKTADPDLVDERLRRIADAVAGRKEGGRARKLCIDGTNERYFATTVKKSLRALLPVEIVVGSETIEKPGYEPMTMKQFLGSKLIGELDDNHLTLPPDRYIREDWRLVKKERGALVCEPDVDGKHGDTFDAAKLALWAVVAGSGEVKASGTQVGTYGRSSGTPRGRMTMRPNHESDHIKERGVVMA